MYRDLDEPDLARLCSENDRQAQNELYTRYATLLFTLCRRYTKDESEALDLLQDSIIKALNKISSFKYSGKGSLYAWIRRITVNAAIDNIRKHRIKLVSLDLFNSDTIPEPQESDVAEITQEQLLDIISDLPEAQRAVFNMFCIDGYSHKEIAEMLGISEKGSASMLAKARKQLKIRIYNIVNKSE